MRICIFLPKGLHMIYFDQNMYIHFPNSKTLIANWIMSQRTERIDRFVTERNRLKMRYCYQLFCLRLEQKRLWFVYKNRLSKLADYLYCTLLGMFVLSRLYTNSNKRRQLSRFPPVRSRHRRHLPEFTQMARVHSAVHFRGWPSIAVLFSVFLQRKGWIKMKAVIALNKEKRNSELCSKNSTVQ